MSKKFFLGIDAGGTKCSARLTNEKGDVIGEGLAGPANTNIGIKKVFRTIMDAAKRATKDAGLTALDMEDYHVGIGVAGIDRHGAYQTLQDMDYPFRSVIIKNDAYIANLGAHQGEDGGTVVVGTGSVAVGQIGDKFIRVGGYGFPISDEGSGSYIGLAAIRITVRACDGRIPHSDLTRQLWEHFYKDSHIIVAWMDKANASEYAALAPTVLKAALNGDRYARQIMERAARHIGLLIHSLESSGITRISMFGGLSKPIKPWLTPDIRRNVVTPKGDALNGALLMAKRNLNSSNNAKRA